MADGTAVEQYLVSKGLEYRYSSGDQLQLTCPACGGPKFYINSENWLYECKSQVCSFSGNERKLKGFFKDKMEDQGQSTTRYQARPQAQLPDMEAAHSALLSDDEVLDYLNDERGISLEVVKKMKLGVGTKWFDEEQGEVKCLMYPYYLGKNLVFVKYRNLTPGHDHAQRFRSTGGIENPLYNSNAIKNQMEYLLLVEGEGDTNALLSAGEEHVAGVPGCDMKNVIWDKLLDRPRKKYLLFDNDEAGQAGAKKFAQRFGVDQYYNIVLPSLELAQPVGSRTHSKDVGEWLMAGGSLDELRGLMEEAQRFDIDDVADTCGALIELEDEINGRGGNTDPEFKWFLPSINQRAGGFNRKELVVLLAPAKSGKTSFAINEADYLAQQGHTVFFDCYEMSRSALVRKWASLVMKIDDTPGKSKMNVEVMHKAADIARSYPGKIIWGNPQKIKTLGDATQRVRDAVRRYGCDVFMFDNLQLLVNRTLGMSNIGNRVTYMGMVSAEFKGLTLDLNVGGVLISQPKRIQDTELVNSYDTEGSSQPEKDCDSMLVFNRFMKAKMKRSDMEKMGAGFTTDENFTPTVNVKVGLSRYAPGGITNIHFEGCMSWFREISNTELEGLAPAPLLGPGEGIGTAVAI